MAKRPHRRRRILIDRLQLHLLAITGLYFLAASLLFATALFGPLIWELQNRSESAGQRAAVASEFLSLHARFWPALGVTFVLLALHSVYTSHRIVGPLYRFRRAFAEITEGNLAQWVGLRRRDFLMREASALNDMIFALRERIDRISRDQAAASQRVTAIEGALRSGAIREARVHVVELEEALNSLARQLEGFQLEADKDDS